MSLPDGAIDIHVHAGPSFFTRRYDAIELAELMADHGVAGFVLKSHFGDTYVAATLASSRVPDVEVYSSVTLNSFVGGFNPTAVEHGIETGARFVWLPTFSAANFGPAVLDREFPFSNQALTATDEAGRLKDEVRDVLETIGAADRQIVLGNGHLSRAETYAVFDAMEDMGLDVPYLITHADFEFMGLSVDDQIELADRGAVIEKCYLPVVRGDVTIDDVAESVRAIGPDHCVLSTDHGQPTNQSPPDAFAAYVDALRDAGVDDDTVEQMAVTGPRSLLDRTAP